MIDSRQSKFSRTIGIMPLLWIVLLTLLFYSTGFFGHRDGSSAYVSAVDLSRFPMVIAGRPVFGFNGQTLDALSGQEDEEAESTGSAEAENSSNGTVTETQVNAQSDVVEKNFTQLSNHFTVDDQNSSTFNQRYFRNSKYFVSSKKIHFLYVEGESVADPKQIGNENMPMVALAKQVGAKLWMLEHRYYGKSRPFRRLYASNYKYLRSKQAVEDIAYFIKKQNEESKESNPKWVLFGASYAAALVLWTRTKYPDLTTGAVAGSPLVQFELDNYQYELNLAQSLKTYDFDCYRGMVLAARAIRQRLQYPLGVELLNNELNIVPQINESGLDYKSVEFLHAQLLPLFQLPVQYNRVNMGPFANQAGIPELCDIMANQTTKNLDKLFYWLDELVGAMMGRQYTHGHWYIPNGYKYFLEDMRHTHYKEDDLDLSSARNWLHQQCYEFGTWTTTDNGRNIFGTELPNSYYIALCSDVFGGNIHIDKYDIKDLLWALGNTSSTWDTSNVYKSSRTVIIVGGADPWRTLSPNATTHPTSVVYVADGVGHNAALQPPVNSDSASLKRARTIINTRVKRWLNAGSGKTQTTEAAQTLVQTNTGTTKKEDTTALMKSTPNMPEPPRPKRWIGKLSKEHPNPEHLEAIRKKGMNGRIDVHSNHPLARHPLMHRPRLAEMQRRRALAQYEADKNADSSPVLSNLTMLGALSTWFIEQPVDHFDDSNTLTYQQRYLVNDRYVETHTPPIFLVVGGEAPIGWMDTNADFMQYAQWAKDFHALIYVLEHRYFGDSQPFTNTSVAALKWLTSEQALADIATFIRTMNEKNNDTNPRWILFGGSYPGNLAAAFRVRYPELSLGAVASSAPIQATSDFYGYLLDVERAVNAYGDEECGEGIRKTFYEIQRRMNTKDGRYLMKEELCLYNDWHEENYVAEKDLQQLYASYILYLDGRVQYDDEKHYKVKYTCALFEGCGTHLAMHYSPGICPYYCWGCQMDSCQWLSEYMLFSQGEAGFGRMRQVTNVTDLEKAREEVDAIIDEEMAKLKDNKTEVVAEIQRRSFPIMFKVMGGRMPDNSTENGSSEEGSGAAEDQQNSDGQSNATSQNNTNPRAHHRSGRAPHGRKTPSIPGQTAALHPLLNSTQFLHQVRNRSAKRGGKKSTKAARRNKASGKAVGSDGALALLQENAAEYSEEYSDESGSSREKKDAKDKGASSDDPDSSSEDDSDPCAANGGSGSNWSGTSGECEDQAESTFQCSLCCWCWYCSYEKDIYTVEQIYRHDSRYSSSVEAMRAWLYLTCTDWGYMMSVNYGRNVFEDTMPVNYMTDMCSDIFGEDFNRTRIDNGVRNTNWLYGGQDNYNGTNVVFINGSEDPWHMLSVDGVDHKPLRRKMVKTILMPGTSHCEDMYKWRHGQKAVIVEMRKRVKLVLKKWVRGSEKTNN